MPATVATGGSKAPPATITAPDPGVSSPEASPATPHPPETSSTTAGDSPSATPGEAGASASSASPPIAPVAGVTMTEPVPLRQDLPPWRPTKNELREFSGIIELDIDEHGDVVAARMINAVHPVYDLELLTATRLWKYEPARRNGVAVKSSKRISVVLHPY